MADDDKPVKKDAPAEQKDTTRYSAADLITAAGTFGTTEAGMAGALYEAGLTESGATKAQAERAVAAFLKREIPAGNAEDEEEV